MKKIFQYIGIFIFSGIVLTLGVFAYILSSDTLLFAFKWQESQQWKTLSLAVDRPGFLSRFMPSGVLLDEDALKKSLLLNGEIISESDLVYYDISYGDGFFSISPKDPVFGDVLAISADLYNSQKKTSYRLDKTISLEVSEKKDIVSIQEQKDKIKQWEFEVIIDESFSKNFSDILWYVYYPTNNETCFSDSVLWNPKKYRQISASLSSFKEEWFFIKSQVHVDYDHTSNRHCLLAGVAGEIHLVVDRTLDNFEISATEWKVLSPQEDLQSQLVFDTTSPILPDLPEDSPEFINYKNSFEEALIKKIAITPTIDITKENIKVSPYSIRIMSDFLEWKKYTIHLTDIEDIYGRFSSKVMTFEPKNSPFMAFKDFEKENIFSSGSDVNVRLFSMALPKKQYELKMCRLDSEAFSQISFIKNREDTGKIINIFNLMNSVRVSECLEKEITISDSMKTDFNVQSFFEKDIRPGFYSLYLKNLEDLQSLSTPTFPFVFSIAPSEVIVNTSSIDTSVLLLNSSTGNPISSAQIEIFPQIWDISNDAELLYATGVILWNTNDSGLINSDISAILSKNSSQKFLIIARWNGVFAYDFVDVSPQWESSVSSYFIESNIENSTILNSGAFSFFAKILKKWVPVRDEIFSIKLLNNIGENIAQAHVRPNENGVLFHDFAFDKNNQDGIYSLQIFNISNEENPVFLTEKRFRVSSESDEKFPINVQFSGLNFDGKSPKNLREKKNLAENNIYYPVTYYAPIQLEAILQADSQIFLPWSDFTYRLSTKKNASDSWDFLLEWIGEFDTNGAAYINISTDFETEYSDVEYILEIEAIDAIFWKKYKKIFSFMATLPNEYKTFDVHSHIDVFVKKNILKPGEDLQASILVNNSWDSDMAGKYEYQFLQQIGSTEVMIGSGLISSGSFTLPTSSFSQWEYTLLVSPSSEKLSSIPDDFIKKIPFFIKGEVDIFAKNVNIFSEKNDIVVTSPYASGSILISRSDERGVQTELKTFSGSIIRFDEWRDTSIDSVFFASISDFTKEKNEVVSQFFSAEIQEKDLQISLELPMIFSEKQEKIVNISTENADGASSIDVLIEVFERNNAIGEWFSFLKTRKFSSQFLQFSQKFSDHVAIFDKNFSSQKELSYSQNITSHRVFSYFAKTDAQWKLRVDLPKTLKSWEYTMRISGYSHNSFVQHNKNFSVVEDIVLNAHIPERAYIGDKIFAKIFLQNNTENISLADIFVRFDAKTPLSLTGQVLLNTKSLSEKEFDFKFSNDTLGEIPYTILVKKWDEILAEKWGILQIEDIPSVWINRKKVGIITESETIPFSSSDFLNTEKSSISISLARNWEVLIPSLIDEIFNAHKTSDSEKLQALSAISHVINQKYVTAEQKELLQQQVNDFFAKNTVLEKVTKKQYTSFLQDAINVIELQKNGIKIDANFANELMQGIDFIRQKEQKNTDEIMQLALLDLLMENKDLDNSWKNIDIFWLNTQNSLQYLDLLQLSGENISDEIFQYLENKIFANNSEKLFNDASFLKIRFARNLLISDKIEKSENIVNGIFSEKILDISSLSEKIATLNFAKTHAKKAKNTNINAWFIASGIDGKTLLNAENPVFSWASSRKKIGTDLLISSEKKAPLYYEIYEKNHIDVPALFEKKTSNFISISSKLEKIYEKSGLDASGNFKLREEVNDGFLEKNALYRVTTFVKIENTKEKNWTQLRAKIFLPSASIIWFWKKNIDAQNTQFLWDFIEKDENAIFLEKSAGSGDQVLEYSYYFRPKNTGSYLLPAAYAYFAEGREFFANDSHKYIHIK